MDAEHDKLHVNRGLSSSSRAECLAKVDNILRRPTSRAWRSFLSPEYRTEVPEGTRWPAKFHPWHWSDVASRQRKLIHNHTATPDGRVCVASASAVWTGFPTTQDCRRLKICSTNTFGAIVHTGTPDTTQTGLSCRVWCGAVNRVRPTSVFSVGVCRAAQALPVRPLDALRRTCRAASIHSATPLSRLPVDRRRRDAGQAGSYA